MFIYSLISFTPVGYLGYQIMCTFTILFWMILANNLLASQQCYLPEWLIVNILLPLNRLNLINSIDYNENYLDQSVKNNSEQSFQLNFGNNNNYRPMKINSLFINFIDRLQFLLYLLTSILFHSI